MPHVAIVVVCTNREVVRYTIAARIAQQARLGGCVGIVARGGKGMLQRKYNALLVIALAFH